MEYVKLNWTYNISRWAYLCERLYTDHGEPNRFWTANKLWSI